MTGAHPPVSLQLQPEALPTVRAAIEEALTDLQVQLMLLTNAGFIPEPWMGDPISEDVRAFYNTTVMESKDGPLAALFAYQAELIKVRDSVKAMEDHYRRTEGDNVALWGRQA
jgi:hypothetical protein